ncbi:MAG: nucleoside kinase [Lachnospiraceae bacterium]|nr:nucleoside kinase [Lachnospiraceae bacterium]
MEKVKIKYKGNEYEYPKGTTLFDIAKDFQKDYQYPIVLAVRDYKLKELFHTVKEDTEIQGFETLSDHSGHKAYKRSACMILLKAMYDVLGREKLDKVKVEFSMGDGYYISVKGSTELNDSCVSEIKARMRQLVDEDIKIDKKSYPIDKVREMCSDYGMKDKERLFHYRMSSSVNMYSINDFTDYYYGFMVPSTGYVKYFDLVHYDEGLLLQLPKRQYPLEVKEIKETPRLFTTMKDATKWNEIMRIETVGELNDQIAAGRINDIILVQEALQESKISEIAREIVKEKKRFVMIAGPSSSGKTSFSHRLSIQLAAHGMKPHPIALDNYFVPREFTPVDSEGKKDYECLEAIDIDAFNENMTDLLKGKIVEMPTYNFITGEREYKGNTLSMGPEDVLVIEGIHGLNDRLSHTLSKDDKYKIYISALTTLNIDEHNRIPTTDGRLIRRLVRDARTRGASANRTLGMWGSVRRGEEQNIFPFQESSDAMFNSALIYELAALKQFAEPLLFSIKKEDPEYQEALRLLKFLQYFLGISTENLPRNSIVREFVGGSVFDV